MAAEIIKLEYGRPEAAFRRAREVVRSGGVIAYPTDTFYGLGVDPRNITAVRRLFEIKGRPAGRPILLLIKDQADIREWASRVTPAAETLMKRHWPGPLTLVFSARPEVFDELTGGTGTIGVRVPGNDLTVRMLEYLDTALTGTSANRSGGPDPRSAKDVADALGDDIDLILDGGAAKADKPSTVVDVSGEFPDVIREGAVRIAFRKKSGRLKNPMKVKQTRV